jgi:hypothetical protein
VTQDWPPFRQSGRGCARPPTTPPFATAQPDFLAQCLSTRLPSNRDAPEADHEDAKEPHHACRTALLRRRITAGGQAELMRRRPAQVPTPRSGFAGFRFPSEVIMVAVRWYLRYGLSYRDVEELLAERGIAVDHVTIYRWVQRFTPLLIEAARPCRHASGDRWFVDETYVKVAAPRSGTWRPRADSSPAHYSTARDPLRSRLTKHRPTPE